MKEANGYPWGQGAEGAPVVGSGLRFPSQECLVHGKHICGQRAQVQRPEKCSSGGGMGPPPWKVATCTPPSVSPSPGGRRLRSLMHVCVGQGPPEERTDRMCVRCGEVMDTYRERCIVQWLRSPTICIGELGPSGANGRPSPRAREPGH